MLHYRSMKQSASRPTSTEIQQSYRIEKRLVTGDDWHLKNVLQLRLMPRQIKPSVYSADAAMTDARCLLSLLLQLLLMQV